MLCKNCQTEIKEGEGFCANCGTVAEQNSGSALDLLKTVCSSQLFLILCVLASVGPVVSIISSGLAGIIGVAISAIYAISLWLMYLASTKSENAAPFVGPLKAVNILTTVEWVINWIASGLLILCGIIFMVGANAVDDVFVKVTVYLPESVTDVISELEVDSIMIIMGVVVFLVAAIVIAFNIFFYGKLRKCTASFKNSAISGTLALEKVVACKNWLMVIGVINAISAISNFSASAMAGVTSLCSAAACIIASLVLKSVKEKVNCN